MSKELEPSCHDFEAGVGWGWPEWIHTVKSLQTPKNTAVLLWLSINAYCVRLSELVSWLSDQRILYRDVKLALTGSCALDKEAHAALATLHSIKPGKKSADSVSDANLACRRIAAQHPVLFLRYAWPVWCHYLKLVNSSQPVFWLVGTTCGITSLSYCSNLEVLREILKTMLHEASSNISGSNLKVSLPPPHLMFWASPLRELGKWRNWVRSASAPPIRIIKSYAM